MYRAVCKEGQIYLFLAEAEWGDQTVSALLTVYLSRIFSKMPLFGIMSYVCAIHFASSAMILKA